MSLFNKKTKAALQIQNYAGAPAYGQSPELELVSILLTSFVQTQYYRTAGDTNGRLCELVGLVDAEFAAKAAVYARTRFGMRSISHVMAGELAKYLTGKEWAKTFYEKIVCRPDDMTEIMAYYMNSQKMRLPNAMKKGFAAAFGKFDGYQLAKYRAKNKILKLVDVVNLVRPKPNDHNREALSLLVKNELRSAETWESQLSKAGQVGITNLEKHNLKAEAWTNLIQSGKIGYFALLRNLRNIMDLVTKPVLDEALTMLINPKLIQNSLVLPFRFSTAYDEIKKLKCKTKDKVLSALEYAAELSLSNVPRFKGNTLVALDTSGSMIGNPSKIGALFASILVRSNRADLLVFSEKAAYVKFDSKTTLLRLAKSIKFSYGGTNFNSIFEAAKYRYDRIIILSDMQAWMGNDTPERAFEAYKKRYDVDPLVYSFDLQGYGSLQFSEHKIVTIAGFSEKVFDLMAKSEVNPNALLDEIKNFSW